MSDAESTVKFAIFDAIVSCWHLKNNDNFSEVVRDKVFELIFDPHLKWAVEDYLNEIRSK